MCKRVSFFKINQNSVFLPQFFFHTEYNSFIFMFKKLKSLNINLLKITFLFLHLRETHQGLQLIACVLFVVFSFAGCVSNIEASHIRDFGPCHNFLIPPEMDSAISKNNSSVRRGLSLEKISF